MIIAGREIKRLVASGCSFTHGMHLERHESWPAQLAALMDIECVNLGKNSAGNEHVMNTIVDHFVANPTHKQTSLVIPCFSTYTRTEFKLHNGKMLYTMMGNKLDLEFCKFFFKVLFNEQYYYLKYMRIVLSLQSILSAWNTPYLMFEAMNKNPHDLFRDEEIMQQIDATRWMMGEIGKFNIDDYSDPMYRLPDGHPAAEAYAEIANILYKHLREKYEDQQ